jgi:hypothetical protein
VSKAKEVKTKVSGKFTVETVKWKWAEPVQNKNVYRDDEFVRSKTKEEALAATEFLLGQPKGLTYTVTTFKDGEFFTYWRHSMPCLGGLVKYRDSHGEKHFMNPYFPRDIYVPFPEGDIIYIGCCRPSTKDVFKLPYYEFIFSAESPWVAAFGNKKTIIFKDSYFILTNMNTDPTVFYSLMRLGGFAHHSIYGGSRPNWNPKADILLSRTHSADPRRLAAQKPIKTSGGTWAEGFGYTRPYNESIYKETLPHKFKDLGSAGSYPNAPHTMTYFQEAMKKNFGITNVQAISQTDKKAEAALVEAWDYFKEQAKELKDE